MRYVVHGFSFDSFMFGRLTEPRPQRDSRSLLRTTHPREWLVKYDRNAYIEVDPRVTHTRERVTPFVWDSATMRRAMRGSHAGWAISCCSRRVSTTCSWTRSCSVRCQ